MREAILSQMVMGGFAVLVLLAVLTDLRSRRIPNLLTVSGLVAALLLRASLGGDAMAGGLQGAGLAFLVTLPLFLLRGIGGGDLKLLVAIGAFIGPEKLLLACVFTAIAGGALSLLLAFRWGALPSLLRATGQMVRYFLTFGRAGTLRSLALPGVVGVPYGVAIGVGSALAWFL